MAVGFAFSRHAACHRMGIFTRRAIPRLPSWRWLRALHRRICYFGLTRHYESTPFGIRRGCHLRCLAANSCFTGSPQEVRTLTQEAALSRSIKSRGSAGVRDQADLTAPPEGWLQDLDA